MKVIFQYGKESSKITNKLRNYKDLEAVLEELSALTDKKTLLEMYKLATDLPHSFWYINLIAKKIEDMFFIQFNQRSV